MNKQRLSLSWFFAVVIIVACMTDRSMAHDTWVQSGPLVTRRGDVVHVDLMLGNHGNEHRDFKLASKITLAPCLIQLINPDGTKVDIKPLLKDMGSAEKEGYWSGRVIPEHSGVYQVIHTLNTLHGKTRAIKSSKTFFIAAEGFSSLPQNGVEQIQPLKQGLELVLITPLSEVVAGKPLTVKVLQHGRPLPNTSVAFIPRGSILVEGKDPNFERVSDENGIVAFVPPEGNLLLVVAHHVAPNESGDGYDKTHYGATLVLPVPQLPYAK